MYFMYGKQIGHTVSSYLLRFNDKEETSSQLEHKGFRDLMIYNFIYKGISFAESIFRPKTLNTYASHYLSFLLGSINKEIFKFHILNS